MKASTSEEMKALLSSSEFDFRFSCGSTRNVQQIQVQEKEDFIRSIWLHYVLFQPLGELDQLRQGLLDTLQVRVLSLSHGTKLRSLLAYSKVFEVTTDYLQEAFVIDYSPNGSNKRTSEEAIVLHWMEYLEECKGQHQRCMPRYILL